MSRLHLKTETESGIRKVVLYIRGMTMDNVQNCASYINAPSLQTYRRINMFCTRPDTLITKVTAENSKQIFLLLLPVIIVVRKKHGSTIHLLRNFK
jgi:hypothetical protein